VRGEHWFAMWPVVLLAMIILIAACAQSRPPGFLTRVREDCANGDPWACDLLTSLSNATPRNDPDGKRFGEQER
jgi:hypothetical protein